MRQKYPIYVVLDGEEDAENIEFIERVVKKTAAEKPHGAMVSAIRQIITAAREKGGL